MPELMAGHSSVTGLRQIRTLCTPSAALGRHLKRESAAVCAAGEGIVSEQQPPWDPFSRQDPRQGQGQPQYPPEQPYGYQQPYGQQPPPQPSFTPGPQYGPQPGQAPYQGQPQQPYPQGQPPYGQQPGPYPQQGQNPWQPQPAYQPPGRPRRRKSWPARHKVLTVLGGVIGLIVVISVASAAANGSHPSASSTAPPATQAAAAATSSATPSPTHSAAAARARTVATFTGSGTEKTPRFTATDTWKLTYSFNCAEFGQSGNFQVFEDGGSDFNGVEVNDLAMSKSASTWAYNDGGTHYLEVNSECSWKVKVIDEP
jgi:hypothetical protein